MSWLDGPFRDFHSGRDESAVAMARSLCDYRLDGYDLKAAYAEDRAYAADPLSFHQRFLRQARAELADVKGEVATRVVSGIPLRMGDVRILHRKLSEARKAIALQQAIVAQLTAESALQVAA